MTTMTMMLRTVLLRPGARYSPSRDPPGSCNIIIVVMDDNGNKDYEDEDFDNDVANWLVEAGGTLLPLEFPQAAVR